MKRTAWILAAVAAAAFLLGYGTRAFFSGGGTPASAPAVGDKDAVWTCSMHPQIRMPRPGKCPICGMPLVPARTEARGEAGDCS